MSNTVKQLGFIPKNRGEFDTTGQTRYYKDNVVQYRNGSYICTPVRYSSSNLTAYTTDAPYQDGDTELNPNWELMASVGLVDTEPTAESANLVKSGGVQNELALGAVYDVSAKNPTAGPNNDGKWESLSALLSDANLSTFIPTAVRKGGMSIKFVQSSDNKYVQYFLTKDEWSASVGDWEKMNLNEEVSQLGQEVHGFKYEGAFVITRTGDHSSNNDRITFPTPIPAGEYTFKVESGTTGNSGSANFYVKYVGAATTTSIGGGALGTVITAELANPIESIGIYMSAATNQHTGSMPLSIVSVSSIISRIGALESTVPANKTELEGKIDDVNKRVLNNCFIGDGASYSSTRVYGLITGKTYVINLQNSSLLSDTVATTSSDKFCVKSENAPSGETFTYLVRRTIGQTVDSSYQFTIPDTIKDGGYVEIGGRAVAGTVINFSIEPYASFKTITNGIVRCATAGATSKKEITIPDFVNVNTERVRFALVFSNATTVVSTLSINGNEEKALYYNGTRASATNSWAVGEILDVIYNANYPGYFATTISKLSQSVNTESPARDKTISEAALVEYIENIENGDKSALQYNTDKVSAIVSAASRSPLSYGKINNNLCVAFSLITDLHSDVDRFKRACAFADNVNEIIATLALGDLVDTSKATNPYPLILNYTKPIIPITGNHEVLKITSDGVTGWDEAALLSNMYSADLVAHNGETHPTDKCYWYKDFSKTIDGSTKKVRVIGLHQYESNGTGEQNTGSGKDVTFYSQDQIDWLIARLNECDSNTYVMLLIHYAPTANLTSIECPFTPSASFNFPLQGGSNTGGPSSMSDDEFIPKIIQAWIDGTTLNISCDITVGETVTTITAVKATAFSAHPQKFAGYFCGHTHRDFVGKLTNYPKQLQFAFITTSAATAQQSCDIGRETSGKTQDCFTLVGIDWFKNSVNLIRIGADTTTDMRSRNFYNIPIPTV